MILLISLCEMTIKPFNLQNIVSYNSYSAMKATMCVDVFEKVF